MSAKIFFVDFPEARVPELEAARLQSETSQV